MQLLFNSIINWSFWRNHLRLIASIHRTDRWTGATAMYWVQNSCLMAAAASAIVVVRTTEPVSSDAGGAGGSSDPGRLFWACTLLTVIAGMKPKCDNIYPAFLHSKDIKDNKGEAYKYRCEFRLSWAW